MTGGTVGAADQGQRRAERADETSCETKTETEVTGRPHAGAARDHVLGLDDQLRPESGAAVADLDRGAAARRPRDDGHVALRGVPDGVVEERAQQAGELVAVGGEHEPGRHVDADRDRLLGGTAREVRAELAENVRETHGRDVDAHGPAVELGHVEERLNVTEQRVGVGADAVEREALVVRQALAVLLEHRRVAHDHVEGRAELVRERREDLLGHRLHAPRSGTAGECGLHEAADVVTVERLRDVVEGAEAESLDRRVDGPVAGDDEDLDVGVDLLDALEGADAAEAGHLEVEGHDVDRSLADDGESLVTAARGQDLAVALQDRSERLPHPPFVIHDQQPRPLVHVGRPLVHVTCQRRRRERPRRCSVFPGGGGKLFRNERRMGRARHRAAPI